MRAFAPPSVAPNHPDRGETVIDGPTLLLALFVLFAICKGKVQPGGQGVHPDELRRREMERLREERFRDSGHD